MDRRVGRNSLGVDRSGSEWSGSECESEFGSEWIGAWLRRVVSGSELDRAVRVGEVCACERGEETN